MKNCEFEYRSLGTGIEGMAACRDAGRPRPKRERRDLARAPPGGSRAACLLRTPFYPALPVADKPGLAEPALEIARQLNCVSASSRQSRTCRTTPPAVRRWGGQVAEQRSSINALPESVLCCESNLASSDVVTMTEQRCRLDQRLEPMIVGMRPSRFCLSATGPSASR